METSTIKNLSKHEQCKWRWNEENVRAIQHDCNSTTDFRQFKLSSADERALWPGRDLLSTVNYYRSSSPLGCNSPLGCISLLFGIDVAPSNESKDSIHLEAHFNTFHAFVPINSFRYSGQVRKVDGGTIVPAPV